MKKRICISILLMCVAIMLSSCGGSKNDSKVNMSERSMTFEEVLDYTSDVVLAKCRGSSAKEGYTEYKFTVKTCYFSAHEHQDKNIVVIAYAPYNNYKIGKSYVLLLERRPKVLEKQDVYLPLPVAIDMNDLKNSKVQRKLIEEKSDITENELADFTEFLKYITNHITNGQQRFAKDYIRSSDLAEIAEKTEYLAEVEIVSRSNVGDKSNTGASFYECKIIHNFKQQALPGDTVYIWLPNDKTKLGETYVLAFMHYSDPNSNYLQLSCKKNFFTDSETQKLKEALSSIT